MSKSVQKPEPVHAVRVAGASAILYSLAVVGVMILWGVSGLLETTTAEEAFPLFVSDRATSLAGCWLLVVAPLLMTMAALGLFQVLRGTGSWMRAAVTAFIAGALFALLRNVLWLAMGTVLAPAYAEASAATQPTLALMGDTLLHFGTILGDVTGGFLVGVGMLLFSLALLRTRVTPRWIAWLGIVVAATAMVQTLMAFFEELMILAILTAPGFMVWMAAVGVSLLRRPAGNPAADLAVEPAVVSAPAA